VRADPRRARVLELVTLPHAGRDSARDLTVQRRKVVGKVRRRDLGAGGNHPATDVHADRGGDDRSIGRDHGADGCALADMGVGHERDATVHEREPGRTGRLRDCLGVDAVESPHQQTGTAVPDTRRTGHHSLLSPNRISESR
jgi:hypothetical protein